MSIVVGLVIVALVAAAGWLWTPDEDRSVLEARYARAPSTFVAAAGLRIHVRDTGPRGAPAVVLLHGFGSSLHTWEAWAQDLQRDHRVIRLDLPGAGLTGADPGGDYSDRRGVEVIAALMDTLDVPRATVVGHSMGGRLAWHLAAALPSRVERLVLLAPDGFPIPGTDYARASGQPAHVPLVARAMQVVLPRAVLRMNLAPAFGDRSALTDALVDRYYDLIRAPTVRSAMVARLQQAQRDDPVPELRRIEAPTLLVWGAADAMIPASNATDYLGCLPHARLVVLPGVGHIPQEEVPAESLRVVREFLDEDRR